MRPELTKQIVRNASAYKLARQVVDGFFVAVVGLVIANVFVAVVIWSRIPKEVEPWVGVTTIVAAVLGAFLLVVAVYLLRELLHAVFDVADCALANRKPTELI
jgi:hypothetical protein